MKIFVTGGAGYIGALLVPQLLAEGHKVTVYDTMWFGNGHLPDNPNLRIIKGDIRDQDALRDAAAGQDACVYLASVSNNAMYAVSKVTHEVNKEYFPAAHGAIVLSGVKHFIYASSVAVLDPTSRYAQDKLFCESVLEGTGATIVRSASVCGYSTHQRLDTTLNMMVHDACRKGMITVQGGAQMRTHVHIKDLCDFYRILLLRPELTGTFTVVADSQSVEETARLVAEHTGAKIVRVPRGDDRSYIAQSSPEFKPERTIGEAVHDLKIKFDSGYWPDSLTNQTYQNICDLKPQL